MKVIASGYVSLFKISYTCSNKTWTQYLKDKILQTISSVLFIFTSTFSYNSSLQLLSPVLQFFFQSHNCGTTGLPHSLTYMAAVNESALLAERWGFTAMQGLWELAGRGVTTFFPPTYPAGVPCCPPPGALSLALSCSSASASEGFGKATNEEGWVRDGTFCTTAKD